MDSFSHFHNCPITPTPTSRTPPNAFNALASHAFKPGLEFSRNPELRKESRNWKSNLDATLWASGNRKRLFFRVFFRTLEPEFGGPLHRLESKEFKKLSSK
jgi:hypothetical protein